MDEVDCTSQALMRLMNITLTRLTNEELKKKQQEEEEYDRLRNSVGINVDTETYIDAYSLW